MDGVVVVTGENANSMVVDVGLNMGVGIDEGADMTGGRGPVQSKRINHNS